MSDSFRIKGLGGKRTLEGSIAVGGAKNAVIKSMPAALLFEDPVTIDNVPAIEDVMRVSELLTALGASVVRDDHRYTIDTSAVTKSELDEGVARRFRASLVFAGPLLARFGSVTFPHPGGDIIGPRPINLSIDGFKKMGATLQITDNYYTLTAPGKKLRGADIFFLFVSVTATETLMMAAVLAEGVTTLRNAAMEPEIVALAEFLNACGARIEGAGTPTITIEGGPLLSSRGRVLETLPDRIEAGSFLLLGALAGKELTITKCVPEHIEMLISLLRESGNTIEVSENTIVIRGTGSPKPLDIRTHEYPGFATDLQPPMTVYLTQAEGESTVFETIFAGRLNYTEDLRKMGADITLSNPQQVTIKGPTPLVGRELESPDVRAGLAFVMAAIIANGESVINHVYHIDRGYARVEERFQAVGVSIERIANEP